MPDNQDNNNSSDDNSQEVNQDDLKLDDVVGMEANDLTDTHKEFLEENKGNLTEDQKSKFGFDKEGKEGEEGDGKEEEEEDQEIDPNKIKIGVKRKNIVKKPKEEEEEIDADDEATITKIVDKKTASMRQNQQRLEDQQAVDALIADTPELKKYRAIALKYMQNPSYNNVPAHRVMGMLSGEDQQKIGARKEREASKKARDTRSGGFTARRVTGAGKDWARATTTEVEAQIARAKGQRI